MLQLPVLCKHNTGQWTLPAQLFERGTSRANATAGGEGPFGFGGEGFGASVSVQRAGYVPVHGPRNGASFSGCESGPCRQCEIRFQDPFRISSAKHEAVDREPEQGHEASSFIAIRLPDRLDHSCVGTIAV